MGLLKRALRTFDSSSLTGSFQNVGAVIPFATTKAALINTSNVNVYITDGSSEENIEIPANGTVNIGEGIDIKSGRSQTHVIFLNNSQLQIKQVTGSGTGKIILNLLGIG